MVLVKFPASSLYKYTARAKGPVRRTQETGRIVSDTRKKISFVLLLHLEHIVQLKAVTVYRKSICNPGRKTRARGSSNPVDLRGNLSGQGVKRKK